MDVQGLIAKSCEKLVGLLGVYNIWIALTDGPEVIATASSFENGFAPLKERMASGWHPPCLEASLKHEELVIIENVHDTCAACPLADQYNGRIAISCQIRHEGEAYGALRVSAPEYMAEDEHVHRQIHEAAGQIAIVLHQVAERRQIEKELQESRRQLSSLMNSLPGMAYRCRNDALRTMEFVSEGCHLLTGYTKEDFEQGDRVSYAELVHPQDRASVAEALDKAKSGPGGYTLEYRIVRPSGEERWVWERGHAVSLKDGDEIMLEGFITDITERLKMSEQLQQMQKHESLSVMAGGVAHDFNNILAAILGNAELAQSGITDPSEKDACLQQIITSCQQAGELCRQMLCFASGDFVSTMANLIDLKDQVGKMEPLFHNMTDSKVNIALKLEDGLPRLRADASSISQIILQLVVNASESYQGKPGKVRLASGVTTYDGQPLANQAATEEPPAGRYVWVSVSDDGCGMDEVTRTRMFEPFFSTKFTGRGMGLAAVMGLVHSLRGKILVDSSPGSGTTVKVLFPVGEEGAEKRGEAASPPEAAAAQAKVSVAAKTVLLVEDEETLRTLSTRMLEREGCKVYQAESGEEAVNVYRQHGKDIDMVFMDLTMGGIDGIEASRQLRAIDPAACIILTTGYREEDIRKRYDTSDLAGILLKPFTREDMLRLFRSGKPPR